MRRAAMTIVLAWVMLGAVATGAMELHSTTFPEGRTVDAFLEPLPGAAKGRINTTVSFRDGQSRIEIGYQDLKPAILFAGDVTCYVLWAVSRDGNAENLGEFLVDEPKGQLSFTTGKKAFALIVTAEPYYLVGEPSSRVVYFNFPSRDKRAPSTPFEFDRFGPSPSPALESIESIAWDSKTPLPLLQARKAMELATRNEAPVHAGQIYEEAADALAEANDLMRKSPKSRQLIDAARRSVAMSNEALNITARRKEGIAIEKQIAARRAEMEALEQRAADAERSASQAEEMVAASREDMERLRVEKQRMSEQTEALRQETQALESAMAALRLEKQTLEQTKLRLQEEKSDLSERLAGALSHVADTQNTARGYVVNLPDILFDVNQAALKPEIRQVLAKLTGILLVISDLEVAIEGHTDSTGGEEYNLELSRRRAEAVLGFLAEQGVAPERLRSVGYGVTRPIASNDTAEGRRKNRRVEIVISEK